MSAHVAAHELPVVPHDAYAWPVPDSVLARLTETATPPTGFYYRGAVFYTTHVLVPQGTARCLPTFPVRLVDYDGVERQILDDTDAKNVRAIVRSDGVIEPQESFVSEFRKACERSFYSRDYVALCTIVSCAHSHSHYLHTYNPPLPDGVDFGVLALNVYISASTVSTPGGRFIDHAGSLKALAWCR